MNAGIIDAATAERMQSYYRQKESATPNRLFIVFGILGGILIGLGIILIIAHNWDNLSVAAKTFFAFFPLVLGQIICGYVLVKKRDDEAWRESAAAFLFFAIGACISMIGQIYHISGDLTAFLLTWMLLASPLVYIMNSAVTSILYLCGITFYATQAGYNYIGRFTPWAYWGLLALLVPFYYLRLKKAPGSNFVRIHHWLIAASLMISLGAFAGSNSAFMYLAYMSLFGFLFQLGSLPLVRGKFASNGYIALSILGTLVLLIVLSFNWIWHSMVIEDIAFSDILNARSFYLAVIISASALVLFLINYKEGSLASLSPFAYLWAIFLLLFVIGMYSAAAPVLVNIMVLLLALYIMREGNLKNHLGLLNFGLLIIAILAFCRFLDTELSFVVRGLLFIAVGVGFFLANYYLLKKRKSHAIQ